MQPIKSQNGHKASMASEASSDRSSENGGTNGASRPQTHASNRTSIAAAWTLQRWRINRDRFQSIDEVLQSADDMDPADLRSYLNELFETIFGSRETGDIQLNGNVSGSNDSGTTLSPTTPSVTGGPDSEDRRFSSLKASAKRRRSSSSSSSSSTDRRERLFQLTSVLGVPDAFGGEDVDGLRADQCRWDLLARPQNKPDVPTVAVTDPEGKTKYPHDHTYYPDADGGAEDSDVWD
ncbi:Uu.00g014620.m01.CDS01 [Anthostomella pinea]|uniref:Uu.00g014620.m01.CDS01 n=1 Tax=Anthostomella pinea TaxID=933095 RepID=A0AAI8VYC7_9PEZI|nr:Uu.00g014620.m01.CDS01 [Anthostomella pinea]